MHNVYSHGRQQELARKSENIFLASHNTKAFFCNFHTLWTTLKSLCPSSYLRVWVNFKTFGRIVINFLWEYRLKIFITFPFLVKTWEGKVHFAGKPTRYSVGILGITCCWSETYFIQKCSVKLCTYLLPKISLSLVTVLVLGKGKAIPLQALTGPEGSRRLKLPDFKTIGTWRWQGCQP
jgi:hypothetical protein